jgi:hypothetical protein
MLALFAYYCAHGCALTVAAEQFGVSDTAAKRINNRVRAAFNRPDVYSQFVRWPTDAELVEIEKSFRSVRNFPRVAGCIDGTHIATRAPLRFKSSYVNRKGWTSLNVTAVVDDQLRFLYVVPDAPGCMHDANVLASSPLARLVDDLALKHYWLLGDPAYALTTSMMKPFRNETSQEERNFNYSHSSTRMAVECAFGKWKMQWRILASVRATLPPATMAQVVRACACLHNATINDDMAGRSREAPDYAGDADMWLDIGNFDQVAPSRPSDLSYLKRKQAGEIKRRAVAESLPITCL